MLPLPQAAPPRRNRLVGPVLVAALSLVAAVPAHAVTVIVTTTADSGAGSLRAAINTVNNSRGTIKFNIPLAMGIDIDSGQPGGDPQRDVFRIEPLSPLPALDAAIFLDGDSQRVFGGDTNPLGPEIAINGGAAGAGPDGLVVRADACRIKNLTINGWSGNAIVIGGTTTGTRDTRVAGCYIGTNFRAGSAIPNGAGVRIQDGSQNNVIGGTTPDAANVISGNTTQGVVITGADTSNNKVQGNFIGTNHGATAALGNGTGVLITANATANTVGGSNLAGAVARNIISGNRANGVTITATDNKVQGNYIGTDATGAKRLPNGGNGVTLGNGGSSNMVGGASPTLRNVISGNLNGVEIRNGATLNLVQGNFIGTRANGNLALPNSGAGVFIMGGNNTIGGTSSGARNVISGNAMAGVNINSGASGNIVAGNYIGIDKSGALRLGNRNEGVIIDGAPGNTIGGTASGARNVISANSFYGVGIFATAATGNKVQGNYIGTDAAGTAALGNAGEGVLIENGKDNLVGGTTVGSRNVISANGSHGVGLSGGGTKGNEIRGNYIGTDVNGSADLGNVMEGVSIRGLASHNIVGGVTSRAANHIAFNARGVRVRAGTGNTIRHNSIFGNDGLGIDLDPTGVTPNDIGPPHDTDNRGPNDLQNFPQLSSATTDGSVLTIMGRLRSAASTSFIIEFFANPSCDPSGSGEGKIYIGAKFVTTDVDGEAYYQFNFADPVLAGQVITATATDPAGNTSEFSICESVIQAADSSTVASAGGARRGLG